MLNKWSTRQTDTYHSLRPLPICIYRKYPLCVGVRANLHFRLFFSPLYIYIWLSHYRTITFCVSTLFFIRHFLVNLFTGNYYVIIIKLGCICTRFSNDNYMVVCCGMKTRSLRSRIIYNRSVFDFSHHHHPHGLK